MLIKLTYYGKNHPTLVNTEKIETIYRLYDKSTGRYSTKITFGNNSYVNVEEDLETIMKIQQDFHEGKYQDTTCITPPFVDERIENNYNQEVVRTRRPRRNYKVDYETNNQW